MSTTEYPTTDVELIKERLTSIENVLTGISARLDGHAVGINGIGENLQWLVQNTQGIFQMFANPAFMSQMANTMTGLMNNAGANPDPASVGPTGEDAGTTGR